MNESTPSLEEFLFEAALGKASTAERTAFLDAMCQGQPALRARLEMLLEGHFAGAGFLTQVPPGEVSPTLVADQSPSDVPAQMIGRYKLLEKIGEGGFGEVWMAEQREPVKRRVAFKIIKLGMDTRQVVARFEAERQALAMMEHPHIARILDAGATDTGRPYFVMELVRGVRITEYCDHNQLSARQRLQLFILVCQAVQHAHQKGIIHRDIKPSNVLVTLHDGVPVPKVIDFGIAKATQQELTDKTVFTQFQQFIGTPAYISPEQAEMSGLDIDTRADIYSLGVLLYELLVGRTPFDAAEMVRGGLEGLRRTIREKDPPKPSTKLKTLPAVELTTTAERRKTDAARLTHLLRGDLDWIVMKCLEKDRARRYPTANGLAMDLQRYLDNEPIVAHPPGAVYRIRKLIRRNRVATLATTAVVLALGLGLGSTLAIQRRANLDYRQRLYDSEVARAGVAWRSGQIPAMKALLDHCPPELRNWEWNFLQTQASRWTITPLEGPTNFAAIALSPDQRSLLAWTPTAVEVRDFPSGWLRTNITVVTGDFLKNALAIAPQGDRFAILSSASASIRIHDLQTGEVRVEMHPASAANALAWTPDGREILAGGTDGVIRVWDSTNGFLKRTFTNDSPPLSLAISPDGRTLAVGAEKPAIHLLDLATGGIRRTLRTSLGMISLLVFSPDGQRLAVTHRTFGGFHNLGHVWHLAEGESLDLNTTVAALSFDFSPDNRQLLVGDATGTFRIWDLERREEIERVATHRENCEYVRFLGDGSVLSASSRGGLRRSVKQPSKILRLSGGRESLRSLAFSPDSRWLAWAGLGWQVHLTDTLQGREVVAYPNHARPALAVAFSPDGHVATGDDTGAVHLWSPSHLHPVWTQSVNPRQSTWWLAFSRDNRRLFTAGSRGIVHILDPATGALLGDIQRFSVPTDGVAVSPDGSHLAVLEKQKLSVWRTDASKEEWSASADLNRCAVYSPDGRWIATGGRDSLVTLWKVAGRGQVRRLLRGHSGPVTGVSFSADGRRLASSGMDGVRIWDLSTDAELLTLPLQSDGAWHVAFSPDGKSLAAAGGDGFVTLWKTEPVANP